MAKNYMTMTATMPMAKPFQLSLRLGAVGVGAPVEGGLSVCKFGAPSGLS
jgi:hypothetical protein